VIISASYKTDIPAFYGEWFINRLRAGHCKMVNPYNGRVLRVPLSRTAVDGFVFWTKNLGPFLPRLDEIRSLGYPFIVQYTINGYPRTLEYSVVNAARAIEHMRLLTEGHGARVPIWRYDPIVVSSVTPLDFHRQNFAALAEQMEGATDEVVVSFAQIYQKTKRNMDWAAGEFRFSWEDPSDDAKLALAEEFAKVAAAHGMQLTICSQRQYLAPGVRESKCVDAQRLSDVGGRPIHAKEKGNRPDCGCFASRDIGDYDTCPHGCVYCYAVLDRTLARQRYLAHDPQGEFLFTPADYGATTERDDSAEDDGAKQLILFQDVG
jgi:Domain of unknown function (DUF1848)